MFDTLLLERMTIREAKPRMPTRTETPATDDARAVRSVLAGDLHTYRVLYDRYVRLIHAVCHDVTRDRERAQDLVHDVFLRAYQRLRQLRQPERFGPWLLKIARHICRDWQRQRARDPHVYVGLEPGPDTVDALAPDDRLAALHRALSKLPERERLAVHLAYLEERPAEHARRLLGLSRSGFYRVLDRARKRLEQTLSQDQEVTR